MLFVFSLINPYLLYKNKTNRKNVEDGLHFDEFIKIVETMVQ